MLALGYLLGPILFVYSTSPSMDMTKAMVEALVLNVVASLYVVSFGATCLASIDSLSKYLSRNKLIIGCFAYIADHATVSKSGHHVAAHLRPLSNGDFAKFREIWSVQCSPRLTSPPKHQTLLAEDNFDMVDDTRETMWYAAASTNVQHALARQVAARDESEEGGTRGRTGPKDVRVMSGQGRRGGTRDSGRVGGTSDAPASEGYLVQMFG